MFTFKTKEIEMTNKLFKLGMGISVLMGLSSVQALAESTPWINVRLPYSMTANDLANIYYGTSSEAHIIVKANRNISKSSGRLSKNTIVQIPVTASFTDQPERLGWVQ
jgi:hypothetical protein